LLFVCELVLTALANSLASCLVVQFGCFLLFFVIADFSGAVCGAVSKGRLQ
jgi:hypothetical protein